MCTYNDGNTIFLLSTKPYKDTKYSYSNALNIKPNATFTINGKSYTEIVSIPDVSDILKYTNMASRERSTYYPITNKYNLTFNNYYFRFVETTGYLYTSYEYDVYAYLALKITV